MDAEQVQQVRSFNRAVTRRIGVLEDSYLSRGRPLGEARVLFEIGRARSIDLRQLRETLGLDSGYLSRLLRSLEGQGLVESERKAEDGRVRVLCLTALGAGEYEAYDRLSDDLARALLSGLDGERRKRLVSAMAEVERLLRGAAVAVAQEPAESADAQHCLMSFQAELATRFDTGFDPSKGNNLTVEEMTPPAGYFLLARLDGRPVGCGALKRLGPAEGEAKRVWTAPEARGLGVASRIMDSLEQLAREVGFTTLKLDTNRTLVEAQAMYRKRGYREIPRYNDNPYADHWFEKTL